MTNWSTGNKDRTNSGIHFFQIKIIQNLFQSFCSWTLQDYKSKLFWRLTDFHFCFSQFLRILSDSLLMILVSNYFAFYSYKFSKQTENCISAMWLGELTNNWVEVSLGESKFWCSKLRIKWSWLPCFEESGNRKICRFLLRKSGYASTIISWNWLT